MPPILLALSALALVPWSVWLVGSLPCRYLTQHWGIAWSGFDFGLAAALSLTSIAALRRWSWVDRAATAAATLLVTDAWFDIVTSRGAGAMALASVEAVAAELPVALLCVALAHGWSGSLLRGADEDPLRDSRDHPATPLRSAVSVYIAKPTARRATSRRTLGRR